MLDLYTYLYIYKENIYKESSYKSQLMIDFNFIQSPQ